MTDSFDLQTSMWDNLLKSIKVVIDELGTIDNKEITDSTLVVTLDTCILYFMYQKYDRIIESAIGDLTGKYGRSHRAHLHPSLELYLTGNIHLYQDYIKAEPTIKLPSGKTQSLGYVKALLNSSSVKKLVKSGFKELSDFESWYKQNAQMVIEVMSKGRNG